MKFLTTDLNNSIDYQPNVIVELNIFGENQKALNIDLMKASISELSSVIVSDMIDSVKADLSSIKIEEEKSKSK